MKPGWLVTDRRNPVRLGVLQAFSPCGRYAFVKFRGRRLSRVLRGWLCVGPHSLRGAK